MNPVVIIPVYVRANRNEADAGILQTFDHATVLGARGELPRCLDSLRHVDGIGQIVVIVACDPSIAERAEAQVHSICRQFTDLHTAVFGQSEIELIQQRLEQLGTGTLYDEIGTCSYGAIRNYGLVIAHVLGFDSIVFIDDDEIVDDPEFLKKAVYGLGKMTRSGVPILAKSGYYLNAKGSYNASGEDHWYDRSWPQRKLFNEWIDHAMASKRLSRSNHACGGCLALSEEAYKRVAFDPYIARGEDLDYLLNLRMYGGDMWFDNQWHLTHKPPKSSSEGLRFRQDTYRWTYEYRKVEFSRTQIDLLQLKPSSLEPYPGPFLKADVLKRIKSTARARMVGSKDRAAYSEALRIANTDADAYATAHCGRYFQLQFVWPEAMSRLKNDTILKTALIQSVSQRSVDVSHNPQEGLSDTEQLTEERPATRRKRRSEKADGASMAWTSAAEAAAAAAKAAQEAEEAIAAAATGQENEDEEIVEQAQRSFDSADSATGFDPGATCEIRLNIADYLESENWQQ